MTLGTLGDGSWSVRPLLAQSYYTPIATPGLQGQKWDLESFLFDKTDDGAFRVKFQSEHSGMFITIATNARDIGSIHPFTIVVDNEEGLSDIYAHQTPLVRVKGAHFPRNKPAWVWVRYYHGAVQVGFGRNLGENMIMEAKAPQTYGGGYAYFAVGRTDATGSFTLLDVQPLERRTNSNPNTRGLAMT
jgi:hypothetical protein